MSTVRIVLLAIGVGPHALAAGGAHAEVSDAGRAAGSCFEIIAPQRHAEPTSPILFDRCSGKTWLLVRDEVGRRSAYRWVSIAMQDPRSSGAGGAALGGPASPPAVAPAAVADPAGRKCFTFAGRRYCE